MSKLSTKQDVAELIGPPATTRFVDELVRKRKIPFLRLGHKTVRFDLEKVRSALEKLEVRAV